MSQTMPASKFEHCLDAFRQRDRAQAIRSEYMSQLVRRALEALRRGRPAPRRKMRPLVPALRV